MSEWGRDRKPHEQSFVIQPNRSLGERGAWLFVMLMTLVLGLIGTGFALMGLWLVVPFAGLELLVLLGVFWTLQRRTARTEIVDVTALAVIVTVARRHIEQRTWLPRTQSRVILNAPGQRGHASRLFITSRDLGVEVGACLGEEERVGLAGALRSAIHGQIAQRAA
ncbi:MAG: DUF2244 domain-containing protein [Thioalkalivibrio sp.]